MAVWLLQRYSQNQTRTSHHGCVTRIHEITASFIEVSSVSRHHTMINGVKISFRCCVRACFSAISRRIVRIKTILHLDHQAITRCINRGREVIEAMPRICVVRLNDQSSPSIVSLYSTTIQHFVTYVTANCRTNADNCCTSCWNSSKSCC